MERLFKRSAHDDKGIRGFSEVHGFQVITISPKSEIQYPSKKFTLSVSQLVLLLKPIFGQV